MDQENENVSKSEIQLDWNQIFQDYPLDLSINDYDNGNLKIASLFIPQFSKNKEDNTHELELYNILKADKNNKHDTDFIPHYESDLFDFSHNDHKYRVVNILKKPMDDKYSAIQKLHKKMKIEIKKLSNQSLTPPNDNLSLFEYILLLVHYCVDNKNDNSNEITIIIDNLILPFVNEFIQLVELYDYNLQSTNTDDPNNNSQNEYGFANEDKLKENHLRFIYHVTYKLFVKYYNNHENIKKILTQYPFFIGYAIKFISTKIKGEELNNIILKRLNSLKIFIPSLKEYITHKRIKIDKNVIEDINNNPILYLYFYDRFKDNNQSTTMNLSPDNFYKSLVDWIIVQKRHANLQLSLTDIKTIQKMSDAYIDTLMRSEDYKLNKNVLINSMIENVDLMFIKLCNAVLYYIVSLSPNIRDLYYNSDYKLTSEPSKLDIDNNIRLNDDYKIILSRLTNDIWVWYSESIDKLVGTETNDQIIKKKYFNEAKIRHINTYIIKTKNI